MRALLLFGAGLLLLTAAAVISATIYMQARHGEGRSIVTPVDAAIVLGGGFDPDGALGPSSRRRIETGVALLRDGLARHLVMSGGVIGGNAVSLAEAMRRHAIALGAPPAALLVEGASATTFENVRFSLPIVRAAGFDRLAVVTDDFHLLRARMLACFFGECGIAPVSVPSLYTAPFGETLINFGRETAAWWYNLGKVAAWSALGAAGVPEERRERLVE